METPKEEGEQKKGKIIITSLPMGDDNWVHQMFMESEKQGIKGPLPMVWDEAHNIPPEWFEAHKEQSLKKISNMEGTVSFICEIDISQFLTASHKYMLSQGGKLVRECIFITKNRVSGEFVFLITDKRDLPDGDYVLNIGGIDHKLTKQNQEFYYLHNGQYVGNAMLWWRKGRAGYTTNINEAEKFTREQALDYHHARNTDVPWACNHVDDRAIKVADHQYLDTINILKP